MRIVARISEAFSRAWRGLWAALLPDESADDWLDRQV
jgi:hypothetical protein